MLKDRIKLLASYLSRISRLNMKQIWKKSIIKSRTSNSFFLALSIMSCLVFLGDVNDQAFFPLFAPEGSIQVHKSRSKIYVRTKIHQGWSCFYSLSYQELFNSHEWLRTTSLKYRSLWNCGFYGYFLQASKIPFQVQGKAVSLAA